MNKQVKKAILNVFEMILAFAIFAGGLWLFLTLATSCDAAFYTIEEIDPEGLYVDSRGAEANGSELIEAIRLMMLECGSYTVSYEDKVEHCAILCKQLLYTQTVGGYNGWGTTLWGVMHASNSYLQTAPRIWTQDADPTEEIAEIFLDVWFNGYSSDFRVQCYRTDWYFQGEWAIAAYQIGTTFYSINRWQDFSMFDLSENWYREEPEWIFEENDWFEPEPEKVNKGTTLVRFYER